MRNVTVIFLHLCVERMPVRKWMCGFLAEAGSDLSVERRRRVLMRAWGIAPGIRIRAANESRLQR